MQNEANSCPSCGSAIGESGEREPRSLESSIPVLCIKPVFIPWRILLSIAPIHAFSTLWGGGFFGGFSVVAIQALRVDVPSWSPFLLFGALFFLAIPIVTYTTQKKTYAKTEYAFYDTRLDYHEGFFTTEEKTIDYKNVTQVNLIKGVVQKKYGLGTLVLSTPATSAGGRHHSGIRVLDVANPDQVYRQVKELVDRAA